MSARRIKVYWEITKKFFEVEHANGSRNLYAHPFVLRNVDFVVDLEAKHRPHLVNGERNVHAYAEGDVGYHVYGGVLAVGHVTYDPSAGDTFRLWRDGVLRADIALDPDTHQYRPVGVLPMPIHEIKDGVLVFDIVIKNGRRSPRMTYCQAPSHFDFDSLRVGCWLSDPQAAVPVQRDDRPTSEPDHYEQDAPWHTRQTMGLP